MFPILFFVAGGPVFGHDMPSSVLNESADLPKVIYGEDDRVDVYQVTDPDLLSWAAATCAIVNKSDVIYNGDGTYTLRTSPYRVFGLPACSDEPFGNQPTAAFCTGFMARNDLIVTAGHCIDESTLSTASFVFGFDMANERTPITTFEKNQIYYGAEIVGRSLSGSNDYAVIRTDRIITAPNASPLALRRTDTIGIGQQVGVIGHPSGLPKKIAFGENTRVRDIGDSGYFLANLDTYGGNSGSPIVNPLDGVVEGILVSGNQDFVRAENCFRSYRLPDDTQYSERVSKISSFVDLIDSVPIDCSQNDDFENAFVFVESSWKTTGCNRNATKQSNEPDHAGNSGGASVWWRWTAPASGNVIIHTFGSSIDTLLAVYVGDSLSELVEIESNNDYSTERQSLVSFVTTEGTTYHIAVDGVNGEQGSLTIELSTRSGPSVLNVHPSMILFDCGLSINNLKIETESSWTASVDQSWIELFPVSGYGPLDVQIRVTENKGQQRSATVTIYSINTEPSSRTVAITQESCTTEPFCGCFGSDLKYFHRFNLRDFLGDWLLVGLTVLIIAVAAAHKKSLFH